MVGPPLTTVRLPHRDFGWRAAELLFDALDGRSTSVSTVVLRPELVVRESTRTRVDRGLAGALDERVATRGAPVVARAAAAPASGAAPAATVSPGQASA
jgi:hypothetical protein